MNNRKRLTAIIISAIFICASFATVVSFADNSVALNENNFPDEVFREAIALHYDADGDGKLSPEERDETVMIVSGLVDELADSKNVDSDALTISSIEGIEYFENLRVLRANNIGELSEFDVSALEGLEVLNCSDDGLTSLDLSANGALRELHCCSNEFTSLDFTANTNLEFLHCYANLELESLNINSLTKLENLRCDGCSLASLDLSTNTALYQLNCSNNKLAKLDLSATAVSALTNYNYGKQNISLEMTYSDGKIKAPAELGDGAVISTSLDDGETAYADGAFFTEDYARIKDGFTYNYSVGKSGCEDMGVSVSVHHTHTYAVTGNDIDGKKLTIGCQICGDEHVLDAEVNTVTVNPDCENSGSITHTISAEYEGTQYTDTVYSEQSALGHNYEDVITQPTCTEQGYTTHTCSRCNDSYKDNYVDALGHSFGDWTQTAAEVKPSCTEDGKTAVETRYCSRCTEFETRGGETINSLGHDYKDVVTPPTCTEQGYTTHTCSRCNDTYTDSYVDALGHDYSDVVTPPTCTEQGYTTHTCSRCGDSYTDSYTDASGHTDGEPVRENEVLEDCTEGGTYDEVVYCTVCGEELSRETKQIAPLGHAEEIIPEVKPTCTSTGLTAGLRCSRCGEILTAQQTVSALGHKWDNGVVALEPTVLAEGKMKYTCSNCHTVRYEPIAKLKLTEVTPTEKEADKAVVNKAIKKPTKIHTISYSKKKQLYIYFSPVKGAQNYRIMYRKQGAKKWTKSWTKGKTEFTIKNLKSNGLYEFKFAAYKENSKGKWERGDYSTTSYRYYHKEKITKATVKKNTVNLKWKKDNSSHHYIIEYAANKNMTGSKTVTVSPKTKTSYTLKGLKKGKTYYIRVRAVKKKAGKNYIGEYSDKKVVKIK